MSIFLIFLFRKLLKGQFTQLTCQKKYKCAFYLYKYYINIFEPCELIVCECEPCAVYCNEVWDSCTMTPLVVIDRTGAEMSTNILIIQVYFCTVWFSIMHYIAKIHERPSGVQRWAATWWGWGHRRCLRWWRWRVKRQKPPAQTEKSHCELSSEPEADRT